MKEKMFTRRRIVLWCVVVILAALLVAAMDSRMVVRRYEVDAEEITTPIRVVLVTDLHSCRYGEGQKGLIEAVDAQLPDVILLGGDIFDDQLEDSNTELFLAGIATRYPCYYVTGNHEYWSGAENFAAKMEILDKYGVTILSGTCRTLELNGETINLCGVDDPDSYMVRFDLETDPQGYIDAQIEKISALDRQLDAVSEDAMNGHFTVLLSHRPELFERYASRLFDLVLCGHAHGGQWRIPGVLNGLYAPDQGLFPSYAGGWYEDSGTTMIVSRGLARESTCVPRIFNRPELVVVDIK